MNDRDQFIIEFVKKNRFATPAQLSELLSVSPITIRRDIDRLDKANILSKVHGGVIFQRPDEPKSIGFRSEQSIQEKRKLAEYIARCIVKPGDRIFMDAGSTTRYVAGEITKLQNLTLITHSMSIIDLVKDDDQNALIVVGGEYNRKLQAFVGPLVEEGYQALMADKAFLGANAINLDTGCYDNIGSEKHIKKIINQNAKVSYIVLDSSKFHNTSGLFQSLKIQEVRHIITTLDENDEVLNGRDLGNIEFIFVK